MNEINTRESGNKGEAIAVEYLEKNGYIIKKQNFHFGRHGELDIIAEKDNTLIFVEVRSKTSPNTVNPLLTLSNGKRQKIRRSAEGYLYVNKITNQQCRIDFICVDFTNQSKEPQIIHIENAF